MSSLHRTASTRRDPRYTLRPGSSFVSFTTPNGGACRTDLTTVSVVGLAFELDEPLAGVEAGVTLDGVRLEVDTCRVEGTVAVRYAKPVGQRIEVGGLFYPSDESCQATLMALLAGIAAAQAE